MKTDYYNEWRSLKDFLAALADIYLTSEIFNTVHLAPVYVEHQAIFLE